MLKVGYSTVVPRNQLGGQMENRINLSSTVLRQEKIEGGDDGGSSPLIL